MAGAGFIKDIDRGWSKAKRAVTSVVANMAQYVDVGVLEKKDARSDDIGNMELALIHELGLGDVPERSFIRDTIDLNVNKYRLLIKNLAWRIAVGHIRKKQALNFIGMMVQADMRARITAGIPPPNAESTIARKGSSTPLIDTGQLRASIDYEVGP